MGGCAMCAEANGTPIESIPPTVEPQPSGNQKQRIKIYGVPPSQNACGPVLLAMDLDVGALEFCDIMSGAHKKPEHMKIHPYGQIPALQDGDFCLGESNAILRYLALAYGQKYYPVSDPQLCAKIDFALDAFSNVYKAHVFIVYKVFGFGGENDDQTAKNKEYTDAINKWFDIHVPAGKKFVGGDHLSIADFKVAPFFYAAIQPCMMEKVGFEAPPRAVQFCKDFMAAVGSSAFLNEGGGYAIKEYAASKGSPDAKPLNFPAPGSQPLAPAASGTPSNRPKPAQGIKIHGVPPSQNACGPILLAMDLDVGGLEFCDIMSGAHKKPEHMKIHPYGQIPALQDGDFCLGESNAILRYVALAYGQKYYPVSDPQLCAKIDFALDAFSNVYKAHVFIVYKVFGFGGENDDQTAKNKEYTDAINRWFDIHVPAGKKFVGGDNLTIADFKVAPFYYAAIQPAMKKKLGFEPPPRAMKFCDDFLAAVPSTKFLQEAGGYAIKEFAASKE